MDSNQTNPKQQLFTELFRPKTLSQAVIVPRIRQELEKGLVDNILFYGSPGAGKCLGYNEKLYVYFDNAAYRKYFRHIQNVDDYETEVWVNDIAATLKYIFDYDKQIEHFNNVLGESVYLRKCEISIGDLFKCLKIDNDSYEEAQKVKANIYVESINFEQVVIPIRAYVKKRVNLISCFISSRTTTWSDELICSDKHLIVNAEGQIQKAINSKTCQHIKFGICDIADIEELGEGDAYDIALDDPHLYTTSNGIIHHNTTLSRIMANYGHDPLFINASMERGISTIRDKVVSYASASSLFNGEDRLKVVVLEECDNLTPDAWSSLRATIEQFSSSCRFIANCNYIDKVPEPIQSRFNCIPIEPINAEEEKYLFDGYVNRIKAILNALKITYKEDDVIKFVQNDFPDMRSLVKKVQQLHTRGVTELTAENLGAAFDCSDILSVIMQPGNPWENYKALSGKWANKAEDAVLLIGQKFPEYLQTVAPDKMSKLPLIVIAIAEYNAQLATSIDKFVTLLALIYKLQLIIAQ